MTNDDAALLRDFGRVWLMDGEWMVCRACRNAQHATREGDALKHRSDCGRARIVEDRPWVMLRTILGGVTAPVSVQAVDRCWTRVRG